jgi:hypothetical protein
MRMEVPSHKMPISHTNYAKGEEGHALGAKRWG